MTTTLITVAVAFGAVGVFLMGYVVGQEVHRKRMLKSIKSMESDLFYRAAQRAMKQEHQEDEDA